MKELRVSGGRTFEMPSINEIFYIDEDNGFKVLVSRDEYLAISNVIAVVTKYENISNIVDGILTERKNKNV